MSRLLPVLIVMGMFIIPLFPAVSADLFKTQSPPSPREAPEKMIEDGMKMILGAIKLILKSIPEYKAPEVLENGDIIIRRVQPNEQSPNAGDKRETQIWISSY